MGELKLAYEARSYSSGIVGRSICNARNHHWVAENTGGGAVGAGELFCASIAACAVNVMFEMWGVSDDDAKFLVKTWKQR